MKLIHLFIAALITVSIFMQCAPQNATERQSNVDIVMEIADEIYRAYPDSGWMVESHFSKTMTLKVGTTIAHNDNDTLKFVNLINSVNAKIERINSYRIFSDRRNDADGISGRYVVSVRPDEGDETSTLFYTYKRSACSCSHNKKDSISLVFTVNAGLKEDYTQDVSPIIKNSDRYLQSEPSTEEELKPLEDFFQVQYNEPYSIPHRTVFGENEKNWSVFFLNHDKYENGDPLITNAVFCQRPVTDNSVFEELLHIAEQYKRSPKCDFVASSMFDGKVAWLTLNFIDGKGIRTSYNAVLENKVFSFMKATAATDKGLCIEPQWWR